MYTVVYRRRGALFPNQQQPPHLPAVCFFMVASLPHADNKALGSMYVVLYTHKLVVKSFVNITL